MNCPPRLSLIPRPESVAVTGGVVLLGPATRIGRADGLAFEAEYLAKSLRAATEAPVPVTTEGGEIRLAVDDVRADLGEEGYELVVAPEGVALTAATAAGVFHGAQTLRQLLPEDTAMGAAPPAEGWPVPCVRIVDRPRYRWRGFMMDSGRCFMPMDFLKRYLDLAAYLKINLFHWHFIEDQGWRPEIKRYPRLTEVGAAWRPEPRRQGFYTQDDMREIVAYAAQRHIAVLPEVEVPGHSLAAMLSYPELCCTGEPRQNEGHQKDLYCAGSEASFEFLENVFTELLDIFPFPWFHIGGDEAPKDRWKACPKCQARMKAEGLENEAQLQGYFCKRIAAFLAERGRRIIGWEEILDGKDELPKDAIVQWWRRRPPFGDRYALAAARAGFEVFASPNNWTYTVFPVNPRGNFHVNRTMDLSEAYAADYTPADLTPEEQARVIGGEMCMWMDQPGLDEVDEYMFPRGLAMAEALWSPREGKDFADFHARVKDHFARLDALGVRYGPAFRVAGSRREAKAERGEA